MILAKALFVYALVVMIGNQPVYQRDQYLSYERCVEAAHGMNLGPDVKWYCVIKQVGETLSPGPIDEDSDDD